MPVVAWKRAIDKTDSKSGGYCLVQEVEGDRDLINRCLLSFILFYLFDICSPMKGNSQGEVGDGPEVSDYREPWGMICKSMTWNRSCKGPPKALGFDKKGSWNSERNKIVAGRHFPETRSPGVFRGHCAVPMQFSIFQSFETDHFSIQAWRLLIVNLYKVWHKHSCVTRNSCTGRNQAQQFPIMSH